jgi:hypothetical protein
LKTGIYNRAKIKKLAVRVEKPRGRIEIQPRIKIQYSLKTDVKIKGGKLTKTNRHHIDT